MSAVSFQIDPSEFPTRIFARQLQLTRIWYYCSGLFRNLAQSLGSRIVSGSPVFHDRVRLEHLHTLLFIYTG